MDQLLLACRSILTQLEDVVKNIREEDFSKPSTALSQATIGQHLRHTIEFFICLESGFEKGTVNYDKRTHDKMIERDRVIAGESLRRIAQFIATHRNDKMLMLEVAYETESENWVILDTNYWRELVYNIEHAVHHMAIMKIGIREVAPYLSLPPDFGIAVSTLRYKGATALHTAEKVDVE
jgi:DinB family